MIYSSNRKQFIFVKIVKCGVPQGSILGPLFFLIFVNKLNSSTKVLDPVLFADDTNLFCSGNNIGALFETANQELSQINDWFLANKLSMHVENNKIYVISKTYRSRKYPFKIAFITTEW